MLQNRSNDAASCNPWIGLDSADHASAAHGEDAHEHHAEAPGDRIAMYVTSGFLVLGALLSWLAFFMVFFTFSSIGVPGLNGFAGEFFILLGSFQRAFADSSPLITAQLTTIAVLAVSGVVLGAW